MRAHLPQRPRLVTPHPRPTDQLTQARRTTHLTCSCCVLVAEVRFVGHHVDDEASASRRKKENKQTKRDAAPRFHFNPPCETSARAGSILDALDARGFLLQQPSYTHEPTTTAPCDCAAASCWTWGCSPANSWNSWPQDSPFGWPRIGWPQKTASVPHAWCAACGHHHPHQFLLPPMTVSRPLPWGVVLAARMLP